MKIPQKLKLIEGSFLPKEGKEILMNVFLGKIQFHQMKSFSSQVRFGKEDAVAKKRIPELKKAMEILSKIIAAAEKKGELVKISSEVIVQTVKK